jgi:excisionase family DNA binding protein
MKLSYESDCENSLKRIENELDEIKAILIRLESNGLAPIDVMADRLWCTTDEAAPLLGLAEWTVRYYCRIKRIAAEKLSDGEWRISRKEINRYLDRGPAPEFFQ